MLSRNGYHKNILDKFIREFFIWKFTTKPLLSKKDFHSFAVFRCFVNANSQQTKGFSFANTKMIKRQFMLSLLFTIGETFHFKDRKPLFLGSGIVYKLTYSCGYSVRLGVTYIIELKNMLLQKNPKSVNTCFNILPIKLILIQLQFWKVRMILLGCWFWNHCSSKKKLILTIIFILVL